MSGGVERYDCLPLPVFAAILSVTWSITSDGRDFIAASMVRFVAHSAAALCMI